MVLTDTHCHLDFRKFDPDRAEMLLRAREAGVQRMLIPATSLASSSTVVQLAGSHPGLFCAVGVHPTEAGAWTTGTAAALQALMLSARSHEPGQRQVLVAVGEIGLDYYWDAAEHDQQQAVLVEQLALAAETGLPVILHMREKGDAQDGPCAGALLAILAEWVTHLRGAGNPLADRPGVLHSFSGSAHTAQQALGLGFYLGVTGPVTYRRERQELIAGLPLGSLLLETDAPFLSPHPWRGKRNEPAYVSLIADKIAMLQSTSPAQVAAVTGENARRLFVW